MKPLSVNVVRIPKVVARRLFKGDTLRGVRATPLGLLSVEQGQCVLYTNSQVTPLHDMTPAEVVEAAKEPTGNDGSTDSLSAIRQRINAIYREREGNDVVRRALKAMRDRGLPEEPLHYAAELMLEIAKRRDT